MSIQNKRFTSVCAVLILLLSGGVSAWSEEAEIAPARPSAQAELKRVQADLQLALTNLTTQSSALWQRQHDLEYSDPELKALRASIVDLEKKLLEQRKALQVRLAAKPEIKTLENERKALFKRVDELRLEEEVLQREVRSAQYAPALQEQATAP